MFPTQPIPDEHDNDSAPTPEQGKYGISHRVRVFYQQNFVFIFSKILMYLAVNNVTVVVSLSGLWQFVECVLAGVCGVFSETCLLVGFIFGRPHD